ncbi:polymeric immunoglobulin receptor-like isoform X3 [Thunnus albacares]|uniref:polymeric immunoglobulin receptor-like isoform X3 n=1 Tax=Thunnus albacares TaxID=8236 RepID=UPI001CF6F989|nr:polymeric immunoglobulin receptor-like isoform X3 [Thunnus albacares]
MIFCIRIKLRMNIHHVLFFCFLSALQDGNTGLVNAINLFAGAEGGNGSIICSLTSSGSTKFFCKGKCKEEDILIKTDDVTAQSGRYSIRYEDGSSGRKIVTVTFTQLTKSDSGRYRCGLGGSSAPDAYTDFDITVIDAATLGQNTRFIRTETEGGNITRGCSNTVYGSRKFFCKDECKKEEDILVETEENRAQNGRYSIEYREGSVFGLSVTITQLKKSDTGRYRCGYGRASSPDSSYTFSIFVVDAISEVSRPGYFWPLVVFLLLVVCVAVIVVLLAVVLLLLYKLKKRRNSGLNTRGTSDSRNMELSVIYENRPPVSMYEDSVYQSLDPDSRDPDQTYSALTANT